MKIKTLTLGGMGTNCYVLYDEGTKECAVFDPAAQCDRILAFIEDKNLKIKYIILTHIHTDHIMALDELKAKTAAPVVVHENEAELLNDDTYTLSALFGTIAPVTKTDIKVLDGDTLPFGGSELKIIHTPGHTVGGMCVLCGDILIAGDTLFYGSVGRSDFPGGDGMQLIESIKTKLMCLPDSISVYPGHGPATTIGTERRSNPFINFS